MNKGFMFTIDAMLTIGVVLIIATSFLFISSLNEEKKFSIAKRTAMDRLIIETPNDGIPEVDNFVCKDYYYLDNSYNSKKYTACEVIE